MIKHITGDNPNTAEFMDEYYSKIVQERTNNWMYPELKKAIPKGGSILEVGCGMGADLKWVKDRTRAKVFGIDISQEGIDLMKRIHGIDGIKKDICDSLNFKELYDLIICSQSLEHVDDPYQAIQNMMNMLKPGGTLFLSVPKSGGGLDNCERHVWRQWNEQDFAILQGAKHIYPDGAHHIIVWHKNN